MAKSYTLSEGALKTIMNGGDVSNPIMQVLGSKKITSGHSEKDRYRILLSDGRYKIAFAMLTTNANDKMGTLGIETYSVIKLKRYIISVINSVAKRDTRVLLILEMDVVAGGSEVGAEIGSPVQLTDDANKTDASKTDASSSKTQPLNSGSKITGSTVVLSKPSKANNHVGTPSESMSETLGNKIISPVASLSPYHNKWVVKVRVTNKSPIRTWSNSRGEGKLFSCDLVDESGEIRCTGFKSSVDKFYETIEVDKIYYISKCQLKPANERFTTLNHAYEMTMTEETIIEECFDDDELIPQTKYNFISIDKLAVMEVGTIVDVIGVAQTVSDLQTIVARSTNRELKKKDVALVDESNHSISLTLWGSQAENFEAVDNPIVVIKGAKIGEFSGGKNLSALMSSQLKVNPDIVEGYQLRGWYDINGAPDAVVNVSAKTGGGSYQSQWMSFKEAQEQGLGNSEKGDYYQLMGTILLIRSENAVYKACATNDCNKKVVDNDNGLYRCEKCNREFPNFKYRLLASMNVGDWTGNQWISMFASEAEKVIGASSQEIGEAFERDVEAGAKYFEDTNFKQFIFKCRAKMETYNDESRLKTVGVKAEPINYTEYNAYLVDRIQQLTL